jgi:hypothetical protein
MNDLKFVIAIRIDPRLRLFPGFKMIRSMPNGIDQILGIALEITIQTLRTENSFSGYAHATNNKACCYILSSRNLARNESSNENQRLRLKISGPCEN